MGRPTRRGAAVSAAGLLLRCAHLPLLLPVARVVLQQLQPRLQRRMQVSLHKFEFELCSIVGEEDNGGACV